MHARDAEIAALRREVCRLRELLEHGHHRAYRDLHLEELELELEEDYGRPFPEERV